MDIVIDSPGHRNAGDYRGFGMGQTTELGDGAAERRGTRSAHPACLPHAPRRLALLL